MVCFFIYKNRNRSADCCVSRTAFGRCDCERLQQRRGEIVQWVQLASNILGTKAVDAIDYPHDSASAVREAVKQRYRTALKAYNEAKRTRDFWRTLYLNSPFGREVADDYIDAARKCQQLHKELKSVRAEYQRVGHELAVGTHRLSGGHVGITVRGSNFTIRLHVNKDGHYEVRSNRVYDGGQMSGRWSRGVAV